MQNRSNGGGGGGGSAVARKNKSRDKLKIIVNEKRSVLSSRLFFPALFILLLLLALSTFEDNLCVIVILNIKRRGDAPSRGWGCLCALTESRGFPWRRRTTVEITATWLCFNDFFE